MQSPFTDAILWQIVWRGMCANLKDNTIQLHSDCITSCLFRNHNGVSVNAQDFEKKSQYKKEFNRIVIFEGIRQILNYFLFLQNFKVMTTVAMRTKATAVDEIYFRWLPGTGRFIKIDEKQCNFLFLSKSTNHYINFSVSWVRPTLFVGILAGAMKLWALCVAR